MPLDWTQPGCFHSADPAFSYTGASRRPACIHGRHAGPRLQGRLSCRQAMSRRARSQIGSAEADPAGPTRAGPVLMLTFTVGRRLGLFVSAQSFVGGNDIASKRLTAPSSTSRRCAFVARTASYSNCWHSSSQRSTALPGSSSAASFSNFSFLRDRGEVRKPNFPITRLIGQILDELPIALE